MRPGLLAPVGLALLATACSSADDPAAQPPTVDEQRALAEAQSMIPADELPSATPASTERAADDQ